MDIEKSDGDRNRLVEATWDIDDNTNHNVDIIVESYNRSGLLVDVTFALNDMRVPITGMMAKTTESDNKGIINLTIEVTGHKQLEGVLKRLNNVKGVYSARRA